MMLDQCRNDFQSLIDRIHLHAAFEKADSKDRYGFFQLFLTKNVLDGQYCIPYYKLVFFFIFEYTSLIPCCPSISCSFLYCRV